MRLRIRWRPILSARQVEANGSLGGVVLGISTSGIAAHTLRMETISLAGEAAAHSGFPVDVTSPSQQVHFLSEQVETALAGMELAQARG